MGEKEMNMKSGNGGLQSSGAPRRALADKVAPCSIGMRPSVQDALNGFKLRLPTRNKSRAEFIEAVIVLCLDDPELLERIYEQATLNESNWGEKMDKLRKHNESQA